VGDWTGVTSVPRSPGSLHPNRIPSVPSRSHWIPSRDNAGLRAGLVMQREHHFAWKNFYHLTQFCLLGLSSLITYLVVPPKATEPKSSLSWYGDERERGDDAD